MVVTRTDDSAPGTYGDMDSGGGPYMPESGVREWYNPPASALFGQWMRIRRQMLEITQAEIADRMTKAGNKIDGSAVARLEKGKRKISLDEAELIARILGVDLAYMTSVDWPADLRNYVDEQDVLSTRRATSRPGEPGWTPPSSAIAMRSSQSADPDEPEWNPPAASGRDDDGKA